MGSFLTCDPPSELSGFPTRFFAHAFDAAHVLMKRYKIRDKPTVAPSHRYGGQEEDQLRGGSGGGTGCDRVAEGEHACSGGVRVGHSTPFAFLLHPAG